MIHAAAPTSDRAGRERRRVAPSADPAGLSGRVAALERLLASVAYEVNAPMQFASDSVHYAQDALAHLTEVVRLQGWIIGDYEAGVDPAPRLERLEALRARARTHVSREEAGRALERALTGLERVTSHTRAVRSFTQLPCGERRPVDLNRIVDLALTLGAPEYRRMAVVTRNFSDLPPVNCDPGGLAQALHSLFTCAAASLRESGAGDAAAQLDVHTRMTARCVEVAITVGGRPPPDGSCPHRAAAASGGAIPGELLGDLEAVRKVLVDDHGGVLQVEPGPQGDIRYTLSLPLATSCPAWEIGG